MVKTDYKGADQNCADVQASFVVRMQQMHCCSQTSKSTLRRHDKVLKKSNDVFPSLAFKGNG